MQQSGISTIAALNGTLPDDEKVSAQAPKKWIYPSNPDVIALATHLNQLKQDGHRLFFVTVTYKSADVRKQELHRLNQLFHHFYVRLLRRTVHPRNYARKKHRALHPKVFGWIDGPGSKHKKQKKPSLLPALDTYHHHAVFAVPCEIAAKFSVLCGAEAAKKFAKDIPFIKTIDVQEIGPRDGLNEWEALLHVIDYASEYAMKHHHWQDDLAVIFPISEGERHN